MMTAQQLKSLKDKGQALLNENRLDEARTVYARLCREVPDDAEAWSDLSTICGMLGDIEAAGECCRRAIAIRPDMLAAHRNLGNVLMIQGKHQEALESYRQVLRINPGFPDVYNNIGNILITQGRFEEARESYLQAMRLAPAVAEVYNNLGVVSGDLGDVEEARTCYRKALTLNPNAVDALVNLANLLRDQGELNEALEQYRRALALAPAYEKALAGVASVLRGIDFEAYQPWLDDILKAALTSPAVEHQRLASAMVAHLTLKYGIDWRAGGDTARTEKLIRHIATDELFALFLSETFNTHIGVELSLTEVRRTLLEKHFGGGLDDEEVGAAAVLALQCSNNEYVYYTDGEERHRLKALTESIGEKACSAGSPAHVLESDLLVYAMYDRIATLPCRAVLGQVPLEGWSQRLRPVISKTLKEPLEEERLKPEIPSLAMTDDATSQAVRSQYEENPYPRWQRLSNIAQTRISRVLKKSFPHFTPPRFLDDTVRILVAGCGTGRQPIAAALAYPDSEILAVDLSKSSLAYATRMAELHGVENVRFMQGDILGLRHLEQTFDVILSSGVLHHMEDPLAGWRVLTALLREDGLMNIALYSAKARRAVTAARDVIKTRRLGATKADIRGLRRSILTRQYGEELREVTEFKDFYSLSECRDLLFHVREHQFTCPRLKEALSRLGLEFIGFEFSGTDTVNRYREHFPEDATMTDLDRWDRFEDLHPETFRAMYHFWCRKSSSA